MNTDTARIRWEKAFEKKMTHDEFVMFSWGYAYALTDVSQETGV